MKTLMLTLVLAVSSFAKGLTATPAPNPQRIAAEISMVANAIAVISATCPDPNMATLLINQLLTELEVLIAQEAVSIPVTVR